LSFVTNHDLDQRCAHDLLALTMGIRASEDNLAPLAEPTFDDVFNKLRNGRLAPELYSLAAKCALHGKPHLALTLIGLAGLPPRQVCSVLAELRELVEPVLTADSQ